MKSPEPYFRAFDGWCHNFFRSFKAWLIDEELCDLDGTAFNLVHVARHQDASANGLRQQGTLDRYRVGEPRTNWVAAESGSP